MAREILKSRFMVEAADGRRFEVLEYQQMIPAGSQEDPHAEIPGLPRLVTSDGMAVNHRRGDDYEVVELGLAVRRVQV